MSIWVPDIPPDGITSQKLLRIHATSKVNQMQLPAFFFCSKIKKVNHEISRKSTRLCTTFRWFDFKPQHIDWTKNIPCCFFLPVDLVSIIIFSSAATIYKCNHLTEEKLHQILKVNSLIWSNLGRLPIRFPLKKKTPKKQDVAGCKTTVTKAGAPWKIQGHQRPDIKSRRRWKLRIRIGFVCAIHPALIGWPKHYTALREQVLLASSN